jgi:hypothetical protein
MTWNTNKVLFDREFIFLRIEGLDKESQTIKIDDNCVLIPVLSKCIFDDIFNPFRSNSKELFEKYKGRESYAEYMGNSRIDGFPIFRIDTLSLDREDKISQILN